jgi:hypothetical protein
MTVGSRAKAQFVAVLFLDSVSGPGYVRLNMKALFLRLWARMSRKLTRKPQQLELNLWSRRTRR